MTNRILKSALRGHTSHFTAALLAVATMSAPVLAQETEPAGDAPTQVAQNNEAAKDDTTITVTGSRIRRDEYSSVEPLTVIDKEEMTQAGFSSAAEVLQSVGVTGGGAQINNYFAGFVVNGGTGANTLGLRGLDPNRTLVLLNGRRIAPAGTRGAIGSADLNVLPSAIISSIEILKSGASSIYGSDAVAGVVNILTEKKFDGLTIEAQVDVPEVGAGIEKRLSAVYGYNTDRLHIAASVDYYKRDALRYRDRDFTRCPINGFINGPGEALGLADFVDPATGQPKCFPLDNGGVTVNTIGINPRVAATPGAGSTGLTFNRLRPNAAVIGGATPGYEGVTLDSRDTFGPGLLEQEIVTPAEIYTGFISASYETDMLGNAEFYIEALANKRKSSAILHRQLSLDYPVGSPLIPALFAGSNLGTPSDTTNGVNIGVRGFLDFGVTNSKQEVDFIKFGGGMRGDFSILPNWRYDAYVSNSWTDATYEQDLFLTSRLINATDVVQTSPGVFACASGGSCVPAPALTPAVIGGQLPQNFRDYILVNTIGSTKYREFTAAFSADGPLFKLPGGDVQLAVGAEYRKARIDDTPSPESQAGDLLNLTASLPTRGSDSVWEVFSEIHLPLLADTPFFHRLNVTASGRYTKYKSYGSDFTYKVGGEWEPVRGIGFRGSYGTSFRAPALYEQFLGATTGFQSNQFDPCNDYGLSPDANLRANCAGRWPGTGLHCHIGCRNIQRRRRGQRFVS